MSSYRLDDFKTRVRAVARVDSSTATTNLLVAYLNDTIKKLQVEVKFPQKVTELEKTIPTTQAVDFSSEAYFDTANVISIRDEDGIGAEIQIVPKEIFDKVQPIQDSTSGYPKIAVPITETKYNVYPYGTSSVWKVKYYAKHIDFSADSQTMDFDDLAFDTICNKTIAELLLWKDDDRYAVYEGKYGQGLRLLRKKFNNLPQDLRMQPGTGSSTNADWERIFGDGN